jgi:hypothetical protein
MANWADVRELALALPETTERTGGHDGGVQFRVKDKLFVWERPLRPKEAAELPAPPDGPVLGARVADLGVKDALVAADPEVFFTVSHFDGYPSILVRLDRIGRAELAEVVTDAWLARAPKRLAATYLDGIAPS